MVKSAYISWGYLVRKSIANYLDIDSSELSIGFYISPTTQNAEIFFVEKLENGAGYCNFLSGRKYHEIPQKAIIDPLNEGGVIYEQLISGEHSLECSTSCYDCIRDYSNQFIHGQLDWRLGLDIARLSMNKDACVDFTVEYWRSYITSTIIPFLTNKGYIVRFEGNVLEATNDNCAIMVTHPLWSEIFIRKIKKGVTDNVKVINIIDLTKNMPIGNTIA